MSDSKSSASSGGIGILGLLGVVFVCAKIFGFEPVASWSWWWVTAPFWGGVALFVLIFGLILGGALVVAWLDDRKRT